MKRKEGTSMTVTVSGETGSGKSVLAKKIAEHLENREIGYSATVDGKPFDHSREFYGAADIMWDDVNRVVDIVTSEEPPDRQEFLETSIQDFLSREDIDQDLSEYDQAIQDHIDLEDIKKLKEDNEALREEILKLRERIRWNPQQSEEF